MKQSVRLYGVGLSKLQQAVELLQSAPAQEALRSGKLPVELEPVVALLNTDTLLLASLQLVKEVRVVELRGWQDYPRKARFLRRLQLLFDHDPGKVGRPRPYDRLIGRQRKAAPGFCLQLYRLIEDHLGPGIPCALLYLSVEDHVFPKNTEDVVTVAAAPLPQLIEVICEVTLQPPPSKEQELESFFS